MLFRSFILSNVIEFLEKYKNHIDESPDNQPFFNDQNEQKEFLQRVYKDTIPFPTYNPGSNIISVTVTLP